MTHEELKELAQKLNIEHHHMLGSERLKNLIKEYCENELHKSFEEVATEYGYEVEIISEDNNTSDNNVSQGYVPTDTSMEDEIARLSKITFADVDSKTKKKEESDAFKHAMKLIRCIITCNNPNKSSFQGEIFSARNAKVPEVKKFIPFGTITHIPNILLNVIKEKQCQMFRKEKLPNGNMITRPFLVPEYNIQILDPISSEEFEAIKRRQLADGEGVK